MRIERSGTRDEGEGRGSKVKGRRSKVEGLRPVVCASRLNAASPVSSFPDVPSDETKHSADNTTCDCTGDSGHLEVEQSARHRIATHASEHNSPRRCRPPQAAENA